MEPSGLAPRLNIIAIGASAGAVVVALVGLLAVFSPGGQLLAAPALLPLEWWLGRYTKRPLSLVFSLLGAVLLAETLLLALTIGGGNGASALGVGAALAGGVVFFFTSQRKE